MIMEKEIFTVEQVVELINSQPASHVIIMAVPVMLFLVALEYYVSYRQKKNYYDAMDTLSAAGVGIGNIFVSLLIKAVNFGIILFFYNMVPWSIPFTWWSFILCIVAIDFMRYWAHRFTHENRFGWATHVTHHSSEHYNWSVSFRLGWTQYFKIIFFIPVALMGFHPVVFFISHQIEVLYQFWIHTEFINKLPKPIEFIFTTPSHHRVHHGKNHDYMDKNYGSTFIIWDRMFGTFEPETERPVYGITDPPNSYNPVYLVFHEWIDIVKDVRDSSSLREAFDMVFARPSRLAGYKEEYKKQKQQRRGDAAAAK